MQKVTLSFWNIWIIYHNTTLEFTKYSLHLTIQEVLSYIWLQSCIKVEIRWTIYSLTKTTILETGIGTKSSSVSTVQHRFVTSTSDWDPELTFWQAQEVCLPANAFGLYRSLEAVTTCFKDLFCLILFIQPLWQ